MKLNTFELKNIILLLVTALGMLVFVPVAGQLDQQLAIGWLDQNAKFYLEDNGWLVHIGHEGLKDVVIAIAVFYLFLYIKQKKSQHALFILISMGLSISVIGLLKATSIHACPWSMVEMHQKIIDWNKPIQGLGKCFPGGHASAGFSLIALFFAYYDRYPVKAKILLILAITLGAVMSLVQMLRGAHFLSHNLWALWWSWAISFVLYLIWVRCPKQTLRFKR